MHGRRGIPAEFKPGRDRAIRGSPTVSVTDMRLLFLPACLCLMTWSGATGPDARLPLDHLAGLATIKLSAEPRVESDSKPQTPPTRLASLAPERDTPDAPRSGTLQSAATAADPIARAPRQSQTLSAKLESSASPETAAATAPVLGETYQMPRAAFELAYLPFAPLRALLKPIVPRSRAEICNSLTKAAQTNDLPAPFFIRLLFQESEFKQGVISSAGALGIAQFMPETAADRGLDNPFDPLQAIPASAKFLRDLAQRFGNLGLAAAAYNAGPRRIADWLANKSKLPHETHDYVRTITGRPAENWTGAQAGSPALKLPKRAPCQEAAGLLAWDGPDNIPMPLRDPRTPEPKKTKVAKKGKHDKTHAGKGADKHASKTAETEKKRGADKHGAKAERKRGADERSAKAEKRGDGHVANADKKHAAPEHTAKTKKKRSADKNTAKVDNRHKHDSDSQASRHHDKHRKVELTER